MPDPLALASLLQQQLGRIPSLEEIFSALGLDTNGDSMGREAGAEDPQLTEGVRVQEAMDRQLVKMILFGPAAPRGGIPDRPKNHQGPATGPRHIGLGPSFP